jgi:pSer/pThr/pTyr-binding forkhead associated (FHA) protein
MTAPGGYGAPPPAPIQQPPPPQYAQAPAPPPAPVAAPPQQQSNGGTAPPPGAPVLAAFYGGQRFVVNKDRFIIGRGKQSSDLTIKDPNVSRQHAMVEFLNGQYYMVDMGSTNGVEYNGQRIARKAIAEGDLFRICDHEVRFTYR